MTNQPTAVGLTPLNATIRAEMARRELRQSHVGDAIGLSQAQVSQRLSGAIDWRATELAAVADLFGMSVADLMAGAA